MLLLKFGQTIKENGIKTNERIDVKILKIIFKKPKLFSEHIVRNQYIIRKSESIY